MDGIAKTFQPVTVQTLLNLAGDRKPSLKTDFPLIIVFKPNNKKASLRKCIHMNHSLAIIFNLQLALNRIVKRISENRTNIHNIHRIKQLSVDHTGHINLVLHTAQILTCQQCIQHLIPSLIHSLIIMDLIFQLIKIFISLRITPIRPQRNNMILQVMIAVIDHIYSSPGLLVLLILAVQYGLDRLKFPLDMAGFPL